jgi:hypothetical protein
MNLYSAQTTLEADGELPGAFEQPVTAGRSEPPTVGFRCLFPDNKPTENLDS